MRSLVVGLVCALSLTSLGHAQTFDITLLNATYSNGQGISAELPFVGPVNELDGDITYKIIGVPQSLAEVSILGRSGETGNIGGVTFSYDFVVQARSDDDFQTLISDAAFIDFTGRSFISNPSLDFSYGETQAFFGGNAGGVTYRCGYRSVTETITSGCGDQSFVTSSLANAYTQDASNRTVAGRVGLYAFASREEGFDGRISSMIDPVMSVRGSGIDPARYRVFLPTGIGNGAPVISAVPEPQTWIMMIFGFGLVGAGMRDRKLADMRAAKQLSDTA
jgi:hypothetical protein